MSTTSLLRYTWPMQRDVAAFHDAFNMPNLIATPGPLPLDRLELRIGLLREEAIAELRVAASKKDPVALVDAFIDAIYVAVGALVEMGQDAGNPIGSGGRTDRPFNLGVLVENGHVCAAANEMYVGMLQAAFARQDVQKSIELLDAIITSSYFALLGAGIDPQPFFDEVQRSNMSKLGADGTPIHSRGVELDGYPAGKVLKGPTYSPPDLPSVFAKLYGLKPDAAPVISPDFERGVRAAAEAFRLYFLDENEAPMYYIEKPELISFEEAAVKDALRAEQLRLERAR